MSRNTTVVIVEDSFTQAQYVANYLTEHDLEVMIARDGLQGLRLINAVLPDAIILDLTLPKMDGMQVCRRLKRNPETIHIPVIMLTAHDTVEDMRNGLNTGADDYIYKDDSAIDNLFRSLRAMGFLEDGFETDAFA